MRCEDYPCCGHGPSPMGDGGGCPDSEGRFNCVTCGKLLDKGAGSSICGTCQHQMADPFGHIEEGEDYNSTFQQLADPFGAGW